MDRLLYWPLEFYYYCDVFVADSVVSLLEAGFLVGDFASLDGLFVVLFYYCCYDCCCY